MSEQSSVNSLTEIPNALTENLIGREKHLKESIYKLLTNHFVALIGESGSGKSVLLKEGLVKAIDGTLETELSLMNRKNSSWRIAQLRPAHAPFKQLAFALDPQLALSGELEGILEKNYAGLVEFFRKNRKENENLLIVVDQFEDIFRYRHLMDPEQRMRVIDFINNLVQAVNAKESSIYIAIAIQSEFLGQTAGIPGFSQTIYEGQYFVPPLKLSEIKQLYRQEINNMWEQGYVQMEEAYRQFRQGDGRKKDNAVSNLKEKFQSLKTADGVLQHLGALMKNESVGDSRFMFLCLSALRIIKKDWLKQFSPENISQYFTLRQDHQLTDFIKDERIRTISRIFEDGLKAKDSKVYELTNFQEKEFNELYQRWALQVDINDTNPREIPDELAEEWALAMYDRANHWDINNTTAPETVEKSAQILKALNQDRATESSGSGKKFLGRLGDPFRKIIRDSELLWNVNDTDVEKNLKQQFDANLDLIQTKLHSMIHQEQSEEKRFAYEAVNGYLAPIQSRKQQYFQAIVKALITKERTGRDVRHPITVGSLWEHGPLPNRSTAGGAFDEWVNSQRTAYRLVVSDILRQLEAADVLEVIPLYPGAATGQKGRMDLDYSPNDLIDIKTDVYLSASAERLEIWSHEEAKNSSIYLQLSRLAKDYFATGSRPGQLRTGYELGLNLHWRKEQWPSDGWVSRYDPELEQNEEISARKPKIGLQESLNLGQALDYLRRSQDKFIEEERDKNLREERNRKTKNLIILVISVLLVLACVASVLAGKESRNADKAAFEMGAINLLEFFDQSGFMKKDEIFNYKDSLSQDLAVPRNINTAKKKARFLINFLHHKRLIPHLGANSRSDVGMRALINFYIGGSKKQRKKGTYFNEYLHEFSAAMKSFTDSVRAANGDPVGLLFNKQPTEYHNIIYHTLYSQYESEALDDYLSDHHGHGTSIFALASNPDRPSIFAFGDNLGQTYICRKEGHTLNKISSLDSDGKSNVITAIYFHDPFVFVGNDGGRVFAFKESEIENTYDNVDSSNGLSVGSGASPSVSQLFTYTLDGTVYLFVRLTSQLYFGKVDAAGKMNLKRLDLGKEKIVGSGIVGDQLVLITEDWHLLMKSMSDIGSRIHFDTSVSIVPTLSRQKNDSTILTIGEISKWDTPDKQQLIAVSDNSNALYLVSIDSNRTVVSIPFRKQPHTMRIEDLAFHPEKMQLASASLDGTANIYFDLKGAFTKVGEEPGKNADLKVRENGSPMYYLVYNNENELITTEDIYVKFWPSDYLNLLDKIMEDR